MRNLTVEITKEQMVATGDTYGAKQALKETGWKAQKTGYTWSWSKPVTVAKQVKSEIEQLAQALGEMTAPVLEKHAEEAERGGFAPRPLDFAWELTVVIAGREAYFLASEGNLLPARMEAGKMVPQEVK